MGFVERLLARFGFHRIGKNIQLPLPPLPPGSSTIEIFSQPRHGRSSYLWSVLFMLRKLNLVWPDYLCWTLDDKTEEALKSIHEDVHEGRLPASMSVESTIRYTLLLRKMERWGEKRFVVWDRPDSVFSSNGNGTGEAEINWNVPALWLLSLPNLRDVQVEYLDMLLQDLVLKRTRAGHSSRPLNLIIVLTKGDAIPELPLTLRDYLKQDPLWKAVSSEPTLRPSLRAAAGAISLLTPEALRLYLATLSRAHEEIRRWLDSTLSGRMLLRRAEAYPVNLRFSIVSATGSGIAENRRLQVPWSPRRVLDPLFWSLEMENAPARTST